VHARSLHPPRGPRLARLPLLLAYLLVLLGTPVGEAGFLWMHLATAHAPQPDADQIRSGGTRPDEAETLPARAPEPEHDAPPAHGAGHAHAHASEHEHQHAASRGDEQLAAHEHADPREHQRIASAETEPPARSVAPDEPHEHGGRVHTHRQHPVPDAELLADALSKFYLAPPVTPAASSPADARHARQVPRAPHMAAARIDTPPPRLPG
jgi:hypothetical protein